MDMEELNKSQIVLLTLLVSFVTSLATGIVTVSLMEQGVTPVTNTVNQIVERTKEIIVKVPEPTDPIIITETERVIVHQSDLVAAAVTQNKDSSIRVYKVIPIDTAEDIAQTNDIPESDNSTISEGQVASITMATDDILATETESFVFVSRAIVLTENILAVDSSTLEDGAEYIVFNNEGERLNAIVKGNQNGVAILQVSVGVAATLGDVTDLMRGQTIIILSGTNSLRVMTGIISDIVVADGDVVAIDTDKVTNTPGSMLINMNGELIGMSTGASRTNGSTWFTSSNIIEAALHSNDNTAI